MNLRWRQYWQMLRESLWFVPGLMVLSAFALAWGLVTLDSGATATGTRRFSPPYDPGVDAARDMLAAIAGSMLTVAALAFSLTLAAISLVSTQYSPRVLRNFMRDEVNQFVLGYFVSVFCYCLVVQGTIRGPDEGRFVPATAVLAGLLLAFGGVAALIFFIHHIAEGLQTGTIVRTITRETREAIAEMFPLGLGEPIVDEEKAQAAFAYAAEQQGWKPVVSDQSGYLQQIDTAALMQWAIRHRAVVRLDYPVGAFVGTGTSLFSVRSGMEVPGDPPAEWPDDLMKCVALGRHRNMEQDVGFGIQQLVDIALKALSPAVNDTTTAIMAVDHLGDIGGALARSEFPSPLRSDGRHLRVLVRTGSFEEYIRLSFDLVRINARGNHAVFERLLRALALVASQAATPERKAVLREQAGLLLEFAGQTLQTAYEQKGVRELYAELQHTWQGE
ncbi:MAG: hypothetical protein AVDCRST_MAG56-5598 [uncultured Cytophagales bacterium]|uniref:DUF2254 domain-containing protein n=1 Tax=uncultured Cytophagales bacterium TaxID=158755 RepID=A0A6J4KF58_9SPHI|nr:MAG: hypothetical protein AVDCRST_MAG56-5598 [uncultured Cytophagales bacterium]